MGWWCWQVRSQDPPQLSVPLGAFNRKGYMVLPCKITRSGVASAAKRKAECSNAPWLWLNVATGVKTSSVTPGIGNIDGVQHAAMAIAAKDG